MMEPTQLLAGAKMYANVMLFNSNIRTLKANWYI